MSEVQPPWVTGQPPAPAPPKGSAPWQFKPGQSGNPRGRPPGRPDRRLLATEQMLDEMRNIVAVLVGKALEGDSNSAAIVLSKVMPSLKAQMERVEFDLDTNAPIGDQVASVLDALARGILAPDVARLVIDSIARLSDVRAQEDLAARIEALEAASDALR